MPIKILALANIFKVINIEVSKTTASFYDNIIFSIIALFVTTIADSLRSISVFFFIFYPLIA